MRNTGLEEDMAAHSSILAWRIPWTEETDRLQSIGLQRFRHDWNYLACTHAWMYIFTAFDLMCHISPTHSFICVWAGIQSHYFMANRWETVETVADFIFLGSKITADCDCSHEVKRHLLLGRKVMTSLDSILKSRDITLPTKVCLVKAMVFPVVMYGCESWTKRKLSPEELMLLNCGVGEDSWKSLGLQGDPTSPS